MHHCGLCQFEPPRFTSNVFVPFENRIFVAPVAITHYIAAHWYQPPEIFINAVLACPEMNSMQYKKAILANGGAVLLTQMPPNITVKAVAAFGLHWTSRKRAALYLQR
jgi:hypothetical protein